ncbi:conserved hypothetical protein [Gammaproteobacteria bacterium]
MAYTLAQLAKIEEQPLKKGIMENMIRDSKIQEVLPWTNVNSLQSVAVRVRTLPTGGAFRKIGGTYTETTDGDVEQVWESVYIFGGELKFDRIFDKVSNVIVDPKTQQTQLKLKSMALDFNNYFINGDHATDVDGFEGLKKRVSGMPSRQLIAAAASTTTANPTSSANAARSFLDKWETAWYRCNGGDVNAIFMNEAMYLGFAGVLRYVGAAGGNLLDVTKDSFDRQILTYRGAPFIDMGLKKDQSTEIIGVAETDSTGGDADRTSVYFASFNTENGVTGIQLGGMDVIPLQESFQGPYTGIRIEWPVGLASFGSYGITRLYNVFDPAKWS